MNPFSNPSMPLNAPSPILLEGPCSYAPRRRRHAGQKRESRRSTDPLEPVGVLISGGREVPPVWSRLLEHVGDQRMTDPSLKQLRDHGQLCQVALGEKPRSALYARSDLRCHEVRSSPRTPIR